MQVRSRACAWGLRAGGWTRPAQPASNRGLLRVPAPGRGEQGRGTRRHGSQRAGLSQPLDSRSSWLQKTQSGGWGALLAGRPPAWGWWDGQPIGGTDADTRSLWLLTHFSSSPHTGPADTEGELQPAVGPVAQAGVGGAQERTKEAFPSAQPREGSSGHL